jgi:hypothetical protein
VTYYNHQAIEAEVEPGDKTRECRVCGADVIGVGDTLKHFDEQIRTIAVDREYLPAVRLATEAVEAALSQITERATDHERARAAAVAIYKAGLLRQKAVKPRVRAHS